MEIYKEQINFNHDVSYIISFSFYSSMYPLSHHHTNPHRLVLTLVVVEFATFVALVMRLPTFWRVVFAIVVILPLVALAAEVVVLLMVHWVDEKRREEDDCSSNWTGTGPHGLTPTVYSDFDTR